MLYYKELLEHINLDNGNHFVEWLEANRSTCPELKFIDELMAGCEHLHYHKEGDVWAHTKLVLSHVIANEHDYVDVLAALLHDTGKKAALEANNGKNMAGHERYSTQIAERFLLDLLFPTPTVKLVCDIVRMHTHMNNIVDCKSRYDCWDLVSNPIFYRLKRLAVADARGTIGDDGNPIMDFDERFSNSLAGRCFLEPMPERVVVLCDLIDYRREHKINDIGVSAFKEILESCYKNQINGNLYKKEALIKIAIRCYKQKRGKNGD